ncbi:hypothetical protein JAAARDRAFT_197992 [Jaapia argillacea MUCL 33604]|uniref:Uncharacterized protein n=1 Tax=Jaapia argillacea MUCL 33604 TaxID=933084 RepID=A0A067PRJ5_9AGAM|nr:hypothetical protein JAAARDRAFT_197992 [Jaapia argillacea MUCL 33604]
MHIYTAEKKKKETMRLKQQKLLASKVGCHLTGQALQEKVEELEAEDRHMRGEAKRKRAIQDLNKKKTWTLAAQFF